MSDLDYLNKVIEIRNRVVGKIHDDIPDKLSGNEDAAAYFGVIKPFFEKHELSKEEFESATADTAIAIHGILEKHKKVHFWDDEDAQKQVANEIDDYLYDELKTERDVVLSLDQMDEIIEKVLQVAKHRSFN
jgi:type I restriction enzyme R subunit